MLVFEHIPKTAGTTFTDSYLKYMFAPEDSFLVSGYDANHAEEFARLLKLPARQRRALSVVAGHDIEKFRLVEPDAQYVSIVRDPVQRLISYYRHFRDEPTTEPEGRALYGDDIGLMDFIMKVTRPNVQSEIILGADYASLSDDEMMARLDERFFAVGLTEQFLDFVFYLHLGMDLPLCLFNNRNIRKTRVRIPDPSTDELDAIKRKNASDIRLYDLVRSKFRSQFDQAMTPENTALFSRYRDQLVLYRDRLGPYHEESVALAKKPESWAVRDDFLAIFGTLPPNWPDRPVLQSLDVSNPYVQPGSSFEHTPIGWQLETGVQKWSSSIALLWRLADSNVDSKPRLALKVVLQVFSGQLGLFLKDVEHKDVLSPELEVHPSSAPVEIYVTPTGPVDSGILIIRNRSDGPSMANIIRVDICEAEPESEAPAPDIEEDRAGLDGRIPLWKIVPSHGPSISIHDGAVLLTTDAAQWSYAASLQLDPQPGNPERTMCIRVKVNVGILGIGWVNADNTDWIVRTSAEPTSKVQEVRLVIPAGTDGGSLVFDNWAEGGVQTRALITEITSLPN